MRWGMRRGCNGNLNSLVERADNSPGHLRGRDLLVQETVPVDEVDAAPIANGDIDAAVSRSDGVGADGDLRSFVLKWVSRQT